MIVTLDGQRLETIPDPAPTLQTLIDGVRATHDDRLIVSVAIDGQHLGDDALEAALAQPVPAATQIDLESAQATEIVGDALRGLAAEFAAARDRLGDIAERLSAGSAAAAVSDIGRYIGLWQTCQRVLSQCSGLLAVDLTRCTLQDRTVQDWFEELIPKLVEIRGSLEAHDMVLLADLVRYELPALCDTWQALLEDLSAQVAAGVSQH